MTKSLARLGVFLILAALIAGMAGCGDGGGGYNPPPSQNLEIRTWFDLDAIRDNLAGNHTLMNDLNSTTPGYDELAGPTADSGKGWNPIIGPEYYFTGSFDGQGYEIRDLFINRTYYGIVGLFSVVGGGGRIEGVGVVNANVTGDLAQSWHGADGAGILVGQNHGTVNNCYCTGSVTSDKPAGGLVGINYGTVSNSYYSGNLTSNTSGGGLVGFNSFSYGNMESHPDMFNCGRVINSYYNWDECPINGEKMITIGALSGEDFDQWLANGKFLDVNERLSQEDGYYLINNISDFRQLLAFGQNGTLKFRLTSDLNLATEPGLYIPYLTGEFDGNGHKISNLSLNFSFVSQVGLFGYLASGGSVRELGIESVNINTTEAYVAGGLVGLNEAGNVSNCYATGGVIRNDSHHIDDLTYLGWYAGGLVGHNNKGIVSDSYFSGNVTGKYYVGGLVGLNEAGNVSNSFSTGSVTSDYSAGGLVGAGSYHNVTNSFWDTETSALNFSAGGTGKNTTEMQDVITFSGAGWNITAVANASTRDPAYIWNIVNNVNYPFLSWQPV